MKKFSIIVKNSSDAAIELLLEPLVHVYQLAAGASYQVVFEEQQEDESIEIEYLTSGITIYAGGFTSVTSEGKEVPPQFLE